MIGNAGHTHTPYAALLAGEPVAPRVPSADEHVLTIYTSGTTGKPKGAVITNRNVLAQLDMTDDLFPPQDGDKTLCVLPLFHVFALNGVLNATSASAARSCCTRSSRSMPPCRACRTTASPRSPGVPTMYFYILKHPEDRHASLPHAALLRVGRRGDAGRRACARSKTSSACRSTRATA